MSKVQIKLNSAGVRQLLRSEEMKAICSQLASDARSRCGAGYETDARTGKNRKLVSAHSHAVTDLYDRRRLFQLL